MQDIDVIEDFDDCIFETESTNLVVSQAIANELGVQNIKQRTCQTHKILKVTDETDFSVEAKYSLKDWLATSEPTLENIDTDLTKHEVIVNEKLKDKYIIPKPISEDSAGNI